MPKARRLPEAEGTILFESESIEDYASPSSPKMVALRDSIATLYGAETNAVTVTAEAAPVKRRFRALQASLIPGAGVLITYTVEGATLDPASSSGEAAFAELLAAELFTHTAFSAEYDSPSDLVSSMVIDLEPGDEVEEKSGPRVGAIVGGVVIAVGVLVAVAVCYKRWLAKGQQNASNGDEGASSSTSTPPQFPPTTSFMNRRKFNLVKSESAEVRSLALRSLAQTEDRRAPAVA